MSPSRALVACLVAVVMLVGAMPPSGAAQAQRQKSGRAAAPSAGDTRPNIVFITTDDQRLDEMWMLDNVKERLAAKGTTFARSYANFPLCCPARATFQTGQYAHNHGVIDNTAPLGGYAAFDASNTIATWLDDAGYRTAFVGKYLNEYGAKPLPIPPGWDDWHAIVGGGNYFDTRIMENGTAHQYTGPYQTSLLASIATDIVERDAPRAAPLFLFASFYAPHNGAPVEPDDPTIGTPAVAPKWSNFYDGVDFVRGAAFNEADVTDKPAYIKALGPITSGIRAQLTEAAQQRAESLKSVDTAVGRIVRALADAGELRNTLIVFTSDNGYMRGEHRIVDGKIVPYEPSTRVPLVIRGPGFPAGVLRRQLTGHIDLAPTMLRAAQTRANLRVDGMALQPLAASAAAGKGRQLLLEAGPQQVGGPWFYRGVRTSGWEYIDYGTEPFVELYDMTKDPDQLRNLAYLPAYAERRAALADLLRRLRSCAGPSCRP